MVGLSSLSIETSNALNKRLDHFSLQEICDYSLGKMHRPEMVYVPSDVVELFTREF